MSSANDMIGRLPNAFIPEQAGDLQLTMQFMIEQPMYTVIADGVCHVFDGQAESPDVSLTLADKDLIRLMTGELNGVTAFMTGRLKARGDLMSAQKLDEVFDKSRLS